MRNYIYIISICLIITSCVSPTSYSVIIKKTVVSNYYYLGQDTHDSYLDGFWYLIYEAPADTSVQFEGSKHYALLFRKPTSMAQNENFILLKRELDKEPLRFMIFRKENGKFVRYSPIKTEKKFLELRKKLQVPDSLQLIDYKE